MSLIGDKHDDNTLARLILITVKDRYIPRGKDKIEESQPHMRGQDLLCFILLQLSSSIGTIVYKVYMYLPLSPQIISSCSNGGP